jgi:hypothetical protein
MEENVCPVLSACVLIISRGEELTLWFQIAIDKAHQMQILQRSRDFSSVEACSIFVNTLIRPCLQRAEELATTAILHAKIQGVVRLERVVKGNDERVVAGGQNFLLRKRSFDLVALDHFLLRKHYDMSARALRSPMSSKLTLHRI